MCFFTDEAQKGSTAEPLAMALLEAQRLRCREEAHAPHVRLSSPELQDAYILMLQMSRYALNLWPRQRGYHINLRRTAVVQAGAPVGTHPKF